MQEDLSFDLSYGGTVYGHIDLDLTLSDTPNSDGTHTATAASGSYDDSPITQLGPVGPQQPSGFDADNHVGSSPTLFDSNGLDFVADDQVHLLSAYPSAVDDGYYQLDNAGILGLTASQAVCYCEGTQIATPAGQSPVECLKIGDRVVTRFGGVQAIKWIGRQSFDLRFVARNEDLAPIRIHAGGLAEGVPARDLFVSAGHAMLIEGRLVLARALVNGVTVTRAQSLEHIHYYQIELAGHDCVLAEGAWSETFADAAGWRNRFHNVAEFHALYPHAPPPPDQPILCAPRPEHGPDLMVAVRLVSARARALVTPGPLRGWLDMTGESGVIHGWAQDAEHPELPVLLEVFLDGQVLGSALARDHRADLAAADLANGYCAFTMELDALILPGRLRGVEVRRVGDGASLEATQACRDKLGPEPSRAAFASGSQPARSLDVRSSNAADIG